MKSSVPPLAEGAADGIQNSLTDFAVSLSYEMLPRDTVHVAKARIIDSLGNLLGGFSASPCRIAREVAMEWSRPQGASIVGTGIKTAPDLAAFVNAATARYLEMNDLYHWPGYQECHPSDVIFPVLSAAEYVRASGQQFINAVVLAYEVFLRINDQVHSRDFDNTIFATLASSVAAARLFELSREQIRQCIALAIVPNNTLRQVRRDQLSMYKGAVSGQAGMSGIFAALLARRGMEGPSLPFEGKAGWCKHVAKRSFVLDTFGGGGVPFKIMDTRIKNRASSGATISSILAAEKVARLDPENIRSVAVEVYEAARDQAAASDHCWNPETKETADHSIPYVVAATLMEGTVTLRSFDEAHLRNPALRALTRRVTVVVNDEFNGKYERTPVEHHSRVTVVLTDGRTLVAETGGDSDDLSNEKTDAQIEEKFRGLTGEFLDSKRADIILGLLWNLDEIEDVSLIPEGVIIA